MTSISIDIIDPIESPDWLPFIARHEIATIFHHPAWLRVLRDNYNMRAFALAWKRGGKEIVGAIPFCEVRTFAGRKRWVSLPFSDHCEVLSTSLKEIDDALAGLIKMSQAENVNEIEMRSSGVPTIAEFTTISDSVLHCIKLIENTKSIFESFKKTQVQQPIAKAIRDGLVAEVADSWSAVEEFYRLHLMTRRKLGVPIQPKGFFKSLHAELVSKGLGYIVLVRRGKKCIGGGLFCGFGPTLTYKFGASDESELVHRPNNLVIWTAMQEAIRRGFRKFDFGKTEIAHEGLRKFKSGWGTIESPLYYSYYPAAPHGKLMKNIRERIVAPVIRHSPEFVCRLTGELLYKYFA